MWRESRPIRCPREPSQERSPFRRRPRAVPIRGLADRDRSARSRGLCPQRCIDPQVPAFEDRTFGSSARIEKRDTGAHALSTGFVQLQRVDHQTLEQVAETLPDRAVTQPASIILETTIIAVFAPE